MHQKLLFLFEIANFALCNFEDFFIRLSEFYFSALLEHAHRINIDFGGCTIPCCDKRTHRSGKG